MHLEACRILTDWFSDGSHGVNAKLASVPLDSGDSRPTNLVTIGDETRNDAVARDEAPRPLPSLSVSVDVIGNLDGQTQTVTRDGQVRLRLRISVENPDTSDAKRDLSYYLRALLASFHALMNATNTARTRNQIYLETCLELTSQITLAREPAGAVLVSAYLIPTLQLRDCAP